MNLVPSDERQHGFTLVELLVDRKSTRLNSSHSQISYAVFCLKINRIANLHDHKDYWDWGQPPEEGLLPRDDAVRLTRLMTPYTTTTDVCCFCVCERYVVYLQC